MTLRNQTTVAMLLAVLSLAGCRNTANRPIQFPAGPVIDESPANGAPSLSAPSTQFGGGNSTGITPQPRVPGGNSGSSSGGVSGRNNGGTSGEYSDPLEQETRKSTPAGPVLQAPEVDETPSAVRGARTRTTSGKPAKTPVIKKEVPQTKPSPTTKPGKSLRRTSRQRPGSVVFADAPDRGAEFETAEPERLPDGTNGGSASTNTQPAQIATSRYTRSLSSIPPVGNSDWPIALIGERRTMRLGSSNESVSVIENTIELAQNGTEQRSPNDRGNNGPRFQSEQGRKIETVIYGDGPRKIVVMGSLHGNQAQSISVVIALAGELKRDASLAAGCSVMLIKTANPDGLASNTDVNSNGVDLNRNFPTQNWISGKSTGDRPGSEEETRAVMRLLDDFRPDLVVHVKDSTTSNSMMNCEGDAAQRIARQVERYGGYRLFHGLGAKTTGCLERYCVEQLNTPCLTLLIRPELDHRAAWVRNRTAILSIFRDELEVPESSTAEDQFNTVNLTLPEKKRGLPRAQKDQRPANTFANETSTTTATTKPAGLSSMQQPVPERGYFELPPPPPR